MKRLVLISGSLLFITTFQSESARATISCSTATACSISNLPLYNQNQASLLSTTWDVGGYTNLGSPTAAAMALTTMTKGSTLSTTVVDGSKTCDFQSASSSANAILLLAGLMATSKTTGTVTSKLASAFVARAKDFSPALGSATIYNSTSQGISPAALSAQMKLHRAPVMTYGNYTKTCTALASGALKCTYARASGIVLAVKSTSGSKVTFGNPVGGVSTAYTIALIPTKSSSGQALQHVLPSAFSLNTCYVLDNSSRFVEHMSAIGR